MEESDRGPQDVSSHPFPSCRYQLNVFASLSELMLDLLTISLAPGVAASLKNIPKKYSIIICLWTNCFIVSSRTCGVPLPRLRSPGNISRNSFTSLP